MNSIASHWWMLVARGLTSFAFAALLLLGPGWSSTGALAIAFGVYAMVDGAGSLSFVLAAHSGRAAAYVGRSVLGIAAGVFALTHPSGSTLSLYLIVSTWGMGTGALELVFGSRTWSSIPKPLGFMLAGAVSFGFGLTLLHFPLESVATLRALLVAYAVLNGITATAIGEGLRSSRGTSRHPPKGVEVG